MAHLLNRVVCVAEALTGLVLLANPSFVAEMLLGSDVTGAGVVISRIGGIALIGLGVSCWPGGGARGLQGMTIYNILVASYMAFVGMGGHQVGTFWWPAVATHAVVGILLARALVKK